MNAQRNSYGEITSTDSQIMAAATALVKSAVQKKKLPASFDNISWDRKRRADGYALHHEIYDISPAATRVLLCIRETEGTKYGVKTTSKTYYIIARCGCTVTPVSKALAAKAAKSCADELGHGIAICLGKEKLKLPAQEIRTGYKALTTDESGTPVSVWDGSPWHLGKSRVEKASDTHTGGFYYYRTIDQVLAAAAENGIFGDCRDHKNLVIARVEVSGREYSHGLKLCASKIKPLEIIATVI